MLNNTNLTDKTGKKKLCRKEISVVRRVYNNAIETVWSDEIASGSLMHNTIWRATLASGSLASTETWTATATTGGFRLLKSAAMRDMTTEAELKYTFKWFRHCTSTRRPYWSLLVQLLYVTHCC